VRERGARRRGKESEMYTVENDTIMHNGKPVLPFLIGIERPGYREVVQNIVDLLNWQEEGGFQDTFISGHGRDLTSIVAHPLK
jgi:hypothetical protein